MSCMVLLVLLCLVPTASCDNYCYQCEEAEGMGKDCMEASEKSGGKYCPNDFCYTLWGHSKIGDKVVLGVQRGCLPHAKNKRLVQCIDVTNYSFFNDYKINGTLCKCNGTLCNSRVNPFPTTTTITLPTTTTTPTTTTNEFDSTTDPDAPVASANDWSLSVLTLLILYCTFYVL
ncbi:unnamed protein product [Bursaphelenchus okinawaensis]|uniref:Protein quiver n=1 Tax=Bursaphelenchus okinawaensis TaxID=465554 RepID=A0A811KAY1_9BILA|nr:unnamed protein product [Bursaphelenchus okinawaensis]CAG9098212.1 unnamed protein product [Bursaphelenchus okinawaensis]